MLYSMTGFASRTFILTIPSGEKVSLSFNLKSLNSRFFETTIKLPHTLAHLEITIIKQCKELLKRGHIYFTAYISNQTVFEGSVIPAFSILDSYVRSFECIKERYHLADEISLATIAQLPHIFSQETQELDEKSNTFILSIITELIEKVVQERTLEGSQLVVDIEKRITIIKREINLVAERSVIVVEERKKKVLATLQDIGADENLLANAQKSSLYNLLDKIDIHEEITRFITHLNQLSTHLYSSEIEKGKRLDFTLQELAREINTIAAKCSDAIISSHAITIKVEVEKIREQIQNIV